MTRREFVAATGATAASLAALTGCGATGPIEQTSAPKDEMQFRQLGRTGERVSIVGLGGFHIGMQKTEDESIRIVRGAVDGGINFLDNCWDYNEGQSEIRMGKGLRDGYRNKVFLMTKMDGRDKKSCAKQLDESLQRLQTDHIDLVQMHEVIRIGDPEPIFAAGGAMEALLDARKAGKIRFIGFTGHKSPDIHLKMLETAAANNFRFDTVQMPLNVMDAHFNSFTKKVLPVLVKDNIGVLGMKPMGAKYILESKTVTPIECLHYAMNLPTSVVITGCDSIEILNQALTAAKTFRPLAEVEVAAILEKSRPVADAGKFERYKTTQEFDGTVQHPEWLG